MTTDPHAATPPGHPAGELAQLLATEHWSLLATRSMTWSEVMSRITIHLTIASASLVVLALVAQANGFGTAFRVLSIGLTTAVLVMGTLTNIRVVLASEEDANLVRAMNRLRAAYVDLAPEIVPYLTTSTHDDAAGLRQSYALGAPRHLVTHVAGSTTFFLVVVNTLVAGTLGALVASLTGSITATVLVGVLAGAAHLAGHLALGQRRFADVSGDVRFPTPD